MHKMNFSKLLICGTLTEMDDQACLPRHLICISMHFAPHSFVSDIHKHSCLVIKHVKGSRQSCCRALGRHFTLKQLSSEKIDCWGRGHTRSSKKKTSDSHSRLDEKTPSYSPTRAFYPSRKVLNMFFLCELYDVKAYKIAKGTHINIFPPRNMSGMGY